MKLVDTAQKFSFSKHRHSTFAFNHREFRKHLTNKWNWVGLLKFETVRIHFLSDVFGLLSSKNFATMATLCNDFSL